MDGKTGYEYDTLKYKCGELKYKIESIIHKIKVFFHDLILPWNVIKIKSLNRHWHDRDTILLHVNFQVLCDYIERELFSEHHSVLTDIEKEVSWMYEYNFPEEDIIKTVESIKKSNSDILKLMKLYKWWKTTRPLREENYPVCGPRVKDLNSDENRKWADEFNKYDDICEQEDEDKLIELIKLRKYLWS